MKKFLMLFALPLYGCLAHIPVHTFEHRNVHWRADYEAAQHDALEQQLPILIVMIAGEKDGATCIGGDALRSSALRDPEVIALINAHFVPVWVNVRTTALPPLPFLEQILMTATVDQNRRVIDTFSRNFFLHSVVVSPDGQTLLNPNPSTVGASVARMLREGSPSYAANEPGDYKSLLLHALDRFAAQEATR